MSKSTKIIAALGVVAGLGVAALPAFTYAASVDGNAEVIVEVSPAISLAISGNNDDATGYGRFFESDPSGVYTDGAAGGLSTNVSSSKVSMSPNQIVTGQDSDSQAAGYGFLSTLTVNTNDKGGYTLNVKAATADDVNLTSGSDTIDALSAAAASFTQGTEGWGIKADDDYIDDSETAGIKDDNWYPVTASNQLIRPAVASSTGYANQATKIYYGVSTGAAQPTGTYQSTLTYTATTAN